MADKIGIKIGVEGEREFKQSLNDINSSMKVLGSEMKLVDAEFGKNDKSVEALTAKNAALQKSIIGQKDKVAVLEKALKNASSSFGETDKRTQAWQQKLNEAKAELIRMEREVENNNEALEEQKNHLNEAGDEAEEYGDQVENSGKKSESAGNSFSLLGGICKTAGIAIAASAAAISAAAIAVGKALISMSKDGAAYADTVLTESTVTGIATDKLQEYMYAAELVDVSTETLTNSMTKNINSMKSAQAGSVTFLSFDRQNKHHFLSAFYI